MSEIICRVSAYKNDYTFSNEIIEYGKVIGKLQSPTPASLDQAMKNDRLYGLLRPKNGKSYGYFIKNSDKEVTNRQVRRAVVSALWRWKLKLKFEFHRAKSEQEADLVIQFRTELEDSILNSSTLAYMYYPLGGKNNGYCVINKRFHWNLSGNPVSMHDIDPVNYPNRETAPIQGLAHDLDQVLGHEFGHGIFGLGHFEGIMASHYGIMSEYCGEFDVLRAGAKVPVRGVLEGKYLIFKKWLEVSSERE